MSKPQSTTSPAPPAVDVANPGSNEQYWLQSDHADKMRFWVKRWFPTAMATSAPHASAPADDGSGNAAAAQTEVEPKSCTVFCHGFVEYADRYREIFKVWPSNGHEIVGFDQRGWGETMQATGNPEKAYGYATWPLQFQDLEFVIRETRKRLDEKWGKDKVPIFNMGQSMGGGIVLAFQTRSERWKKSNKCPAPSDEVKAMVKGTIAVAPWLKLTEPPGRLLIFIGKNVLAKIPGFPWMVELIGSNITRDPVAAQNFENDRFCRKKVYLKTIEGPFFGGPDIVDKDCKHWTTGQPLLVVHGTGDLVTAHGASKELVDNITATEDKEFKALDGYYHDILMEPEQQKIEAAQYIVDWIAKRC